MGSRSIVGSDVKPVEYDPFAQRPEAQSEARADQEVDGAIGRLVAVDIAGPHPGPEAGEETFWWWLLTAEKAHTPVRGHSGEK